MGGGGGGGGGERGVRKASAENRKEWVGTLNI